MLLNVVGTIANDFGGMVTCETLLISMCSGGNVDIWLTCSRNGAESSIKMDLGTW